MYSEFYKNITVKLPEVVGKVITSYGFFENNYFRGICYYEIDNNDLLSIIKPEYHKYFTTSLMVITNKEILPHTDSDTTIVINIYIKTANAKTIFYKGGDKKYQLNNQTDGYIYDKKDLTEMFSFQAISGDIWKLNVKEIHSVECQNNEVRIAYCLSSKNLPYNTDVFV